MMSAMDVMTRIAWDWGVRCFGHSHMTNTRVRALRCAEEAVELAQAVGVNRETVLLLVTTVYARPPGSIKQELGGTLLTASVLAHGCLAQSVEQTFEQELSRCLSKGPEHFAKRNEEKIQLGLTG